MRVLVINSHFSSGGPPKIMNGVYKVLKNKNIDCKIAAAREKVLYMEDSIRIGNEWGVKFRALQARLFDNEGLMARQVTKDLIRRIKEYNPDIIQIHNIHGYYLNYELLFSFLKLYGKPVVWTLHDCWPLTGHCAHFDYVGCDQWINDNCSNCIQEREYPKCYFRGNSKRNYLKKKNAFMGIDNMTIVCVSNWLKSVVEKSYLGCYPTIVVYNGVDKSIFKPITSDFSARNGLANKKIVLGVAQNWGKKKGFDDFQELVNHLDDDYKVVLVGLTDDQIKACDNRILGLSRTSSQSELAEIYSSASVFLNLSYEETFGLSTLESIACRTPVIAYDKTAVPEIAGMFNAPIVKAGDISALVDRISTVEAWRNTLNYNLIEEFCEEQKYRDYLNLYLKILSGNNDRI